MQMRSESVSKNEVPKEERCLGWDLNSLDYRMVACRQVTKLISLASIVNRT